MGATGLGTATPGERLGRGEERARPGRDVVSHSSLVLAHTCIKPCSRNEGRGGEEKGK